jgi:hypothetical protein
MIYIYISTIDLLVVLLEVDGVLPRDHSIVLVG